MPRNLHQLGLQISVPQKKWLEEQAEELGISIQEVIRRMIDEFRGVKLTGITGSNLESDS
ncbi:MAG: hypothetical protein GF334_09420 [Candidatus Altiarchaeales archaeon]|nr:hypothetical protein [Candidatus Altiarchaeales archaeon]